jgi:uncharacterized protein YdhG (YjbR/CyaY superfamily)
MQKSQSVDEYIKSFPTETQKILYQIRDLITNTSPEAVESISYSMPAYNLNGKPLIYFAAYENHIGLYATPTGHDAFKEEFSRYKTGKGSVQFPLSEPMPFELIKRVTAFRVQALSK